MSDDEEEDPMAVEGDIALGEVMELGGAEGVYFTLDPADDDDTDE